MTLPFSRKDPTNLAALADRARDAGEWDAAVALYRTALARDFRNPPLWVQYGHALKESGALRDPVKLARAEAAYRRTLAYAPRVADTHLQLGHVLKLQGRADDAKSAYLRALALDPASAAARGELRALGWEEDGGAELRNALASLAAAAPPRRQRPSLIEQADAARDAALWTQAARCYRALLDRDPGNAAIWVQYGHALKEDGNLKDPARLAEAEAAYRRALALAPRTADTHLQLGHVLKLQGKTEEAEAAYLRAFTLDPTFSAPLPELSRFGWTPAEVAELGPSDPPAINGIGKSHLIFPSLRDEDILRIHLDKPRLNGDLLEVSVRDRLFIEGWALARSGVLSVDLLMNEKVIGTANYGMPRWDVAEALRDWPNAQNSGFAMTITRNLLPKGKHTVSLRVCDKNNDTKLISFNIDVGERTTHQLRLKISQTEIDFNQRILTAYNWNPTFLLFVLVGKSLQDPDKAIESAKTLIDQSYKQWRLIFVPRNEDAIDNVKQVHAHCNDLFPSRQSDIGLLLDHKAELSVGLSNLKRDTTLLGIIAAGDKLSVDSLLKCAVDTAIDRDIDFIYSDELRVSPVGRQLEPFLKPQWSPDLLLSTNYIGRLWFASSKLIENVGRTIGDVSHYGEYDLVLRMTEASASMRHIPEVLCLRAGDQLDSEIAERQAIEYALKRRGIAGNVVSGCVPGTYRVQRQIVQPRLVSIIILTRASRGLIRTCVETLRRITAYKNFEIICGENIPPDQQQWKDWLSANADRVIEMHEPFNWPRYNNILAKEARGEYLVFLNDDTEIIDPEWLSALVEHGQRPEIGVVGPMLLWPDRTIQSAGVFLTDDVGRERHAFRNASEKDPGYFGLAQTQRNVIAVNGACLMTRRDVFDQLGRFDEAHRIVNNETDFCLKAHRAGLLTIFTPHSRIVHHERSTRNSEGEDYDAQGFKEQWGMLFADGDPYHHPLLSKQTDDFIYEEEPLEVIYPGEPVTNRESIKRILVVKLDHIGDCITALPAMDRLLEIFPHAKLYVLANRATQAIWSMERQAEEVIEFEFFKARSAEGMNELLEADLKTLYKRLASYNFDLAIDLRRHPETRHILRHTGARLLAGFDLRGRFPWLDIALEWGGDTGRERKRKHATDELLNLIQAVENACTQRHQVRNRHLNGVLPLPDPLGAQIFRRPVVAIHPGAGNEMKRWPAKYFAELIDLVVKHEHAHVVLVGGPDDKPQARRVTEFVQSRDAVFDLSGEISLSDLPKLLERCCLFIGNDSGPKHIAAHLGLPTLGIHAGQVDAREWGPRGEMAVALQRDMECSPCYLSKADLCPRDLACLNGIHAGQVFRACRNLLALGIRASEQSATRM